MPLTDLEVRGAKPSDKPQRLFDSGGLYLEVSPGGGKWWRFKYRFGGKEKRLSLGVYPDVPLAGRKGKEPGEYIEGARDKRDAFKKLLSQGVDPGELRKTGREVETTKSSDTFEVIAREWFEKQKPTWDAAHASRVLSRFENQVFPLIGSRPVADIMPPELLAVVQRIETRGKHETAHRTLGACSQVFRYAVATGRAQGDPSRDLRGALAPIGKAKHFAAVTDPKAVGVLLKQLDGYDGTFVVMCALRFSPLVFARPGEVRTALWADINLDTAEWRYKVTKTDTDHIVPLSTQAVAILRELQPFTGKGKYVFPSARGGSRPMSNAAITAALRRMDIAKDVMSAHGFRAMARTILDEVLGVRVDLIEHQLAHAVKDPNGRAYNRTAHLPERRKMMQQWADYLDGLRGAK